MASFSTADGDVELEVGDDVEVTVADSTVEGGVRVQTGQVTSVRPEENAVWVRGVRVDLAHARVVRKVDSDAPNNLTPPPQ